MRVQELDVETCLELLATQEVGRVAVDDGRGPVVLPVNYVLDRGSVVFRTDLGTKLDAAEEGRPASFQVDDIDQDRRHGWSVLVRGTLVEVTRPAEVERLRELDLHPFASGDRAHFLRLVSSSMTGRRVRSDDRPHPADLDAPGDNVWLGRDGDDLLG